MPEPSLPVLSPNYLLVHSVPFHLLWLTVFTFLHVEGRTCEKEEKQKEEEEVKKEGGKKENGRGGEKGRGRGRGREGGREITYMLEGFLPFSFTDLSSILKCLTSRRYSTTTDEQTKGTGC